MFISHRRTRIITSSISHIIRTMSSSETAAAAATTTSYTPTKWFKPETENIKNEPVLKLYNTLTHSKVEFIPTEAGKIKWYSCGPTVYNSSHMGHARNYVSIDINRRVLQDYFNYDITFIQNVTDIDDKIIIKARQEYLFDEYISKFDKKINEELKVKVKECIESYIAKNLSDFEGSLNEFAKWVQTLDLKEIGLTKPKFPMHVKAVLSAIDAYNNDKEFEQFVNKTKDVIVPVLDAELGSKVTDPSIFKKCSSYWERQYDLDMAKLNVLKPTVVTRVSEYVPEIIEFVEKIIERGYAYATSDGSVYFNTSKFDNNEKHQYAKCQPWSKGDMELIEDGEGSLTNKESVESKLNSSDFALWKSSKAGEPFWESPWGKGRPGWHIECSVMGSDFVGDKMDIHSGGIDLAFPHHDNELAQSEAHFDCDQWVNYFLHTGHLHIEGQKMSKSLKNFITIEEALDRYSSRQLRLCFSLVQWNNPLDFKDTLLNESKSVESTLDKFFGKIRALKRDNEDKLNNGEVISKKFGELEKKLFKQFGNSKDLVHESLCDNLSVPLAIRNMMDLVNNCNIYIGEVGSDIKIDLVVEIVKYLTKMLKIFGFEVREDGMGWKDSHQSSGDNNSSGSVEEIGMPFVKVLSKFRDEIRSMSIKGDLDSKKVLLLCDELRDIDMLELGVALDDRGSGEGALIKFLNKNEREELLRQQREKEEIQKEKLRKKEEQARQAALKEKERMEKAKISPLEMFKTAEYKEWDEEGIPTVLANGEEVSKSGRKKLVKQQQQQRKLHEAYMKG